MMMAARRAKPPIIVTTLFGVAVIALWLFPSVWYSGEGEAARVWFAERTEIEGWSFEEVPINEAAERTLVADRTLNGEFRSKDGEVVRVFSAKRYTENPNEIGLFVHTPDRCWVQGGWRLQSVVPDAIQVILHGTQVLMERRVFEISGNKELVYFCGLLGGQVLPYRLDHNLSLAAKMTIRSDEPARRALGQAGDVHFWHRLWSSFASRRELSGPKQFIRISTSIREGDMESADARLQWFMERWLAPGNFEQERGSADVRVAEKL
jgi:hypothetical protein